MMKGNKGNLAGRNTLLKVFFFLLVSGVPLAAERDVIPDWMRQAATEPVTFDKKAKAGVLLDDQSLTILANGEVDIVERRVTKILRPQAREYAYFVTSIEKNREIRSLHAWSLSGKGDQYELKAKDFSETGYSEELYIDLHYKYARAPAADPGTVIGLEVQYKTHPYMPENIWKFQEPIPVHLARYSVQLPAGWEYKTAFFKHAPLEPKPSGTNAFVWEVRDIAGIDEQPSMPPESSLLARMAFAYYGPGQAVSFGSWEKIGRWYAELSDGSRNDSPELAEKARQLTAGIASTFDKVATLAGFMQAKIRYVEIRIGIGGYQPHLATDVFHHGYGDCKDKATLLSSMLRDVGIASQLALVDHERGVVAPDAPSASFLDHAVLAIRWPDKEPLDSRIHSAVTDKAGTLWVLFDPTNLYTPFGEIGDWLEGNYVLLTQDSGGELLHPPLNAPEQNERRRDGHLKLQEDGTLRGEVEETVTGDDAMYTRLHLMSVSEEDRRKYVDDFLGFFLAGFVLDDLKIDNLGQNNKPLVFHYSFTAHNYAHKAGSLLLFRPRVLGEHIKEVGDEARKYPVYYRYASHQTDTFTITLPAGYTVDELPDPSAADLGFAAFRSNVELHDGALTYSDEYTVRDVLVDANRADDIRRLNGVIAADQHGSAVLKKAQ